jgi:hypothetical protein
MRPEEGEWEQLKIISHGSKQIKLPNSKNFSKLDPNARKLETYVHKITRKLFPKYYVRKLSIKYGSRKPRLKPTINLTKNK